MDNRLKGIGREDRAELEKLQSAYQRQAKPKPGNHVGRYQYKRMNFDTLEMEPLALLAQGAQVLDSAFEEISDAKTISALVQLGNAWARLAEIAAKIGGE